MIIIILSKLLYGNTFDIFIFLRILASNNHQIQSNIHASINNDTM